MRKTSIWARAAAAIFCAIAIVVAPFAQAKSAQEIFAAVAAGVVVVFALDEAGEQIGQGSGVVVGENEVVTNCHVVEDARAVAVRQAADSRGRQTYLMDARMAARDEERDLCLLFVSELSEPPAAIPTAAGRARDLSIGEEVFAVGAPRGLDLSLTRGIVSQLRGDFGKKSAPVIQTDAAISPGSSGGGLFNEDGKLVGITTYKLSAKGNEGLSFAVPAEWVAALQAQAAKEIADEQKRQKCLSSPTVDCLFEVALQTAEKIEDASRAFALRGIANAFADAGFFPNALQTAEKTEDALHRGFALRDIAVAFAKAGLFPNALRTAEKIENAVDRVSALRDIAAAQAEAGHSVDAKNTLANALRTAEKIEYAPSRASALRDIDAAFAEAGHGVDAKNTFANALRTAEKIEGAFSRASALLNIAAAFAEAGHSVDAKNTLTNALRAAEKIEDAGDRVLVLHNIATAQAEAGHSVDAKNTLTNALRAAEKIEDAFARVLALHNIASAFAEAGHGVDAKNTFANALRTAEKIESAFSRTLALFRTAVAQAKAGDIKNAIETSTKIDDESDFAVALARIAAALAKTR